MDKRTAEYKSLNGGYNLYSLEVNGLSKDVYILSNSIQEALRAYLKENDLEPISIKKMQDKIKITGAN